jgi:predicted dehydrogenase
LNILIIGLGSIASKHIQVIRKLLPEASLYALRSGGKKGNNFGVEEIDNIENIDFTPGFVIISNPTHLHYGTLEMLYRKGWPLFIEKPLFHQMKGAEELVEKVASSGNLCYVACNLRFHPGLIFVKNYLEKNRPRVNEVNVYCGSYLPDWRPGKDYKQVYSAIKEQGGGVHLDLIHEIDYVYWLFGAPDNVRVLLSSKSGLNITAIDYADYLLEYAQFNAGIRLNYFRRDPKRTIEIVTENSTLLVDIRKGSVINSNGELLFEKPFNVMQTYEDQMKYFIQCLDTDNVKFNGIKEALEVLKICLNNE